MARYIDADNLLEQLSKKKCEVGKIRYLDGFNDGLMRVRSMISTAPTADVVPKSKVERLTIELEAMRTAANSYKMHYEKARQEVAREIFEEIEKCLKHDYISSIGVYNCTLGLRIAELKKKYTEVKDGTN